MWTAKFYPSLNSNFYFPECFKSAGAPYKQTIVQIRIWCGHCLSLTSSPYKQSIVQIELDGHTYTRGLEGTIAVRYVVEGSANHNATQHDIEVRNPNIALWAARDVGIEDSGYTLTILDSHEYPINGGIYKFN